MKTDEIRTKQFIKRTIPYGDTGLFGKFPIDYLSGNEKLRPFYNRLPAIDSFEDQIVEKAKSYSHRNVLVAALTAQYSAAKLKTPALDLLKSDNSFTITTGHQVCLFTGPLYFFYKIISAINTCTQLKDRYSTYDFIPVFWMATEDHDFEEANHFFLPSGKIEWESGQGGALGRMSTVAMDEVARELKDKIGIGYSSGQLIDLFTTAYIKHKNIGDATRYLVHKLFGDYGVLVVDGDDPKLKALAIPAFEKELTEHPAQKAMVQTNKALTDAGYNLQVSPHQINLFYLDDELRERIEKSDDGEYRVARTNKTFTKSEILADLRTHPEKYSPNVILRPLYQEIILPNLAYFGGGGELAYWFQLKDVFEAFDVPFPVLMLRNSVMIVPEQTKKNMDWLGIDIMAVFRDAQELEDELVLAQTADTLELESERERLESLFLDIENRLRKIEPHLEQSVRSAYVRAERVLQSLEKKMMRAERRKQDVLVNRLHQVRESLVPRNGLQERNMNFVPLYLEYGNGFVNGLIGVLDPFEFEFTVLEMVGG